MKSQVLPEGRAFSFICSKKDKEGMVGMERELFDRAQAACDTRAMADFLVENCDELLQAGGFSAEGPLDETSSFINGGVNRIRICDLLDVNETL